MKKIFKLFIIAISVIMIFSMTSCRGGDSTNQPEEHKCESQCEDCGGCTDMNCTEQVCEVKCEGGHINLPDINVGDLE